MASLEKDEHSIEVEISPKLPPIRKKIGLKNE
jgi:hypothetical protein